MKAALGIPAILRPPAVSSKALPMAATSFLLTRVKDCIIQIIMEEVGIEDKRFRDTNVESKEFLVLDHPTQAGSMIFEK